MRILVVDDDVKLCGIIKKGLEEQAFAADVANDGGDGVLCGETNPYDLIILDVMMPKMTGTEVCRKLRSKKINTPILMLTARDAVEDVVTGLDAGADDYLVKPFSFDELLARVRALVRRKGETKSSKLENGNLVLDTVTREVTVDGESVELTTKEYMVLEYFMRHPGMVISRTMIEEHAWDDSLENMSNVIDVYVRRLRSKLDGEGDESLIQTIRGAGYKLRDR